MLTFSTSFISVNFCYGIHATTASDSFKLVKIDFNKAVFLNSKTTQNYCGTIEFILVSNVIKSNAFLKATHILVISAKGDLPQMFY
jgi:hypothetical protein